MNINSDNYENFFLLYVDNELSAAEKKTVEQFVAQHPDLKEEFKLLQQTVFNADTISFTDKTNLLKNEWEAVQQNLLHYLDDELSETEKKETKELLKTDVAANTEWALLQQTKLQPDISIVFFNKKILYKKESGKIIVFGWRKIAAAAILLGLGMWATIFLFKNNKTNNLTVATIKITTLPQKNLPNIIAPVQNDTSNIDAIIASNKILKTPNTINKINLPKVDTTKEANDVVIKNNTASLDNNLPKPVYEKINTPQSNKTVVANVPTINNAADNLPSGSKMIPATTTNEEASGYALNANLSQGNEEQNKETTILYMDEEKVKKTKMGSFFRKVKRLVERNTNVKAGNSVKVASFNFAVN